MSFSRIPGYAHSLYAREHLPRDSESILYWKKTANAHQVGRVIQWIVTTDPHLCHHPIGNQAEHLNRLAVAVRIRKCLQRQGAHRKQQVITGIDHFLGDAIPDRNIALRVELIYDNGFSFNKSIRCQAVYGAPSALIQQHCRSMLKKSDVWYVPGTGASPSKIGQKECRGC